MTGYRADLRAILKGSERVDAETRHLPEPGFKRRAGKQRVDVRLMYFRVETNVVLAAKSFYCG